MPGFSGVLRAILIAGACRTIGPRRTAGTIVVAATPGTIGPRRAEHEQIRFGVVHAMLILPAQLGQSPALIILCCWRLRFCRPKLPVEKAAGRTSRGKAVRSDFARYSKSSVPVLPSRWRAWMTFKLCLAGNGIPAE